MNWAQENKTLAGIVGVMVAGGLGLGAWLYLSWSDYSVSMEEWSKTRTRMNAIRGAKIAPTTDNVEAREKQLTAYADKVNRLRDVLLAVQQKPAPMSETEFQARLKERSAEVKRMATAAGVKGLSEEFALGFERYAAQPPRSAEIASRLNVHLDAVEKLVSILIEAGVNSIEMVERTKLEDEDAPVAPKAPPPTGKAKTAAAKKGAKKPVITQEEAAEPVLDRYPIKVLMTTDQGPFQTVINSLCSPGKTSPHFLVVRLVRIENSRMDGPSKEEIFQRRSTAAAAATAGGQAPATTEPPKPDAPQVIPVPKPGTVDAFDVMGRETLKVYLEVDYIRFRPSASAEEEEAPAAAPAATAAAKS